MGAHRAWFLRCDECGETFAASEFRAARAEYATEDGVRAEAAKRGWVRDDDRDLDPMCAEDRRHGPCARCGQKWSEHGGDHPSSMDNCHDDKGKFEAPRDASIPRPAE